MDLPKLIDDLGINTDEMRLLKVMLKFNDVSEDMIRENFTIYRKFKEWEKKHPDEYPLLKTIETDKINIENQWFSICMWWDEYCDVRKKVASPEPKDMFINFKNYKP